MSSAITLARLAEYMKQEEVAEKALRYAGKNYLVSEKDFRSISPSLILQLLTLQTAQSSSLTSQPLPDSETSPAHLPQTFWHPNQFKIFAWISVCYAFITNRDIQEFVNKLRFQDREDRLVLQTAFPFKDPLFLEYNLRCLLKQDRSTKMDWQHEETALLQSIISQESMKGKWSDISFSLFALSDRRFFRSSHKCREKWYNHLDPAVRHQKWTVQEDLRLFELIGNIGQRWAAISKAMSGARTEHMVKNRFNSIYKRYAARYQRSSFKKIQEIIMRDLKKKFNAEATEAIDQKELTVKTEEPEQPKQEFQSSQPKKAPCQPHKHSTGMTHLLTQWQNYEQQQAGWFHEQEQFARPIFMKEKIELIDYCMLELQHCQ